MTAITPEIIRPYSIDLSQIPPAPKTLEEFIERANAYFNNAMAEGRSFTINGLCLALGYTHKIRFWELRQCGDEWGHYARIAATMVEESYEKRLMFSSCSGAIFALKQFGWKDTIDHNMQRQLDSDTNEDMILEHQARITQVIDIRNYDARKDAANVSQGDDAGGHALPGAE